MRGKSHISFGLFLYILVWDKVPDRVKLPGLIISAIASIFPDIDHPKSIFNKYILPIKNKYGKIIFFGAISVLILIYDHYITQNYFFKFLAFVVFLVGLAGHRNGLTHSIFAMMIFSFIVYYLNMYFHLDNYLVPFAIGYVSHLIGDMLTDRGIPLFYPLTKKNIKFPLTYDSGGKFSKMFENGLIIFLAIYMIFKIYYLWN